MRRCRLPIGNGKQRNFIDEKKTKGIKYEMEQKIGRKVIEKE